MVRTLVLGGMNWDWYLCGDFNEEDKTVHIFYHERWHRYDERNSKPPKHENTEFHIVELEGRIVTGVKVKEIEYRVTNPAFIFNYKDMKHYVPDFNYYK